jgi:hypothetical protein
MPSRKDFGSEVDELHNIGSETQRGNGFGHLGDSV